MWTKNERVVLGNPEPYRFDWTLVAMWGFPVLVFWGWVIFSAFIYY